MSALPPEDGRLARAGAPELYWRWRPCREAHACLVFVHGYGEHSGRYEHVFASMNAGGLACLGFDLRGHGRSGGRRGALRSFDEYLDDVDGALALAGERAGELPRFLVGHSLGGLIAAAHLQERRPALAGAVLSSPAFALALEVPPWKRAIARVCGRLLPDLALPSGLKLSHLSRDPAVERTVRADPSMFAFARARWFEECRAAQERVKARAGEIRAPLLLLVSGADAVVRPADARTFYERAGSADKQLCWYDGFYHEPFQELEKERVCADLAHWVERRLGAAHAPAS